MRFTLMFLATLFATPALAQEMSFAALTDQARCGSCVWAQANGEITEGTPANLQMFLRNNPYVTVLQINSPGGKLTSGMEMGEILRARNIDVVVGGAVVDDRPGVDRIAKRVAGECASACVFALAGGRQRMRMPGSSIVVHQFSGPTATLSPDSALSIGQRVSGTIVDYLARMNVDPRLVTMMSSASSDERKVLRDVELTETRLLTSLSRSRAVDPDAKLSDDEQIQKLLDGARLTGSARGSVDAFGDAGRKPPSSSADCSEPKFSLKESGNSVSRMQANNRFYRGACEYYFERTANVSDCPRAWDVLLDDLDQLKQLGFTANDLSLRSTQVSISGAALECDLRTARQRPFVFPK